MLDCMINLISFTLLQATNGPMHPSPQVIGAVGEELKAINHKKPSIPWNTTSRGRKKG